ncbi:MAG TPA: site-specific integrase [Trebonia sp.]|jgi:integrase
MANNKGRRRRFGAVRQLPSGQWQARYPGPDGLMHPADKTFPSKTDAEVWLTTKEAEIIAGDWIDPDAGKVLLADFGKSWIDERPGLRPKTVRLYKYLLRAHIAPHFDGKTVAQIKEAAVRKWRKKLLDDGVSEVTTAKAYRLLKAMLNTAVDDGIIKRNPCRIKGAGQEESPERPVLPVEQVFVLADAIDQRYRAFMLLGTFGSLRWAEIAALRPSDIDLANCTIRVERQLIEQDDGGSVFGPPKSRAGKRTVSFPDLIKPDLEAHIKEYAPEPDDLMFTSPNGSPMRHSNFYRRVWIPAVEKAGLKGTHFHDLRHTGNALTSEAGANLRELMARMGHSSTRAALIYLHSTDARQRAIADEIGKNARAALRKSQGKTKRAAKTKPQTQGKRSGTNLARDRDRNPEN